MDPNPAARAFADADANGILQAVRGAVDTPIGTALPQRGRADQKQEMRPTKEYFEATQIHHLQWYE